MNRFNESESNLIEHLGKDLFLDCIRFFQDFYERKAEIKIIMTRRCFTLFKIFDPILKQRGIYNKHGIIITNNAIKLNSESIKNALEKKIDDYRPSASVVIIDDIIIFGRTISNTLDDILSLSKVSELELLKNIIVMCLFMNTSNSKLNENYQKIVLANNYTTKLEWKDYSCFLSSLIKDKNVANTSYIISLFLNDNESVSEKLLTVCQKKAIENGTKELDRLNVKSYLFTLNPDSHKFKKWISFVCMRVQYHEKSKSFILSPLVILKDINNETFQEIVNYYISELSMNSNSEIYHIMTTSNDQLFSTKIRLLILLMSHEVLISFCKKNEYIDYDLKYCDYNQILLYNFSEAIANEFDVLDNFMRKRSNNINPYIIGKNVSIRPHNENLNHFIFEQAMKDNEAANSSSNHNQRLEGFSMNQLMKYGENAMHIFMTFIDNGIASLKSFFDKMNNKYVSLGYPGEQAFRIVSDDYVDYIPFLYRIEKLLQYKDNDNEYIYQKYIEFLLYLKESNLTLNNKQKQVDSLIKYIQILKKTNQTFADVYVGHFKEPNMEVEKLYKQYCEKILFEKEVVDKIGL